MRPPQVHEALSRSEALAPGSNRSFGFVMGGAFYALALLNYWHDGHWWGVLAGIGTLLVATAWFFPAQLRLLNWVWFKFGLLLHKITSPLIMGFIFFTTIVPIGLVLRAARKDLLNLKRDPKRESYWVVRQPPGPLPGTMKDQF